MSKGEVWIVLLLGVASGFCFGLGAAWYANPVLKGVNDCYGNYASCMKYATENTCRKGPTQFTVWRLNEGDEIHYEIERRCHE